MKDPHVDALTYTVGGIGATSYRDPPPVCSTLPSGTIELRDGILTFAPSDHFPSEDLARSTVEPYLRSWEASADLELGIGTIRFAYKESRIIDRAPPPANVSIVMNVKGTGFISTGVSAHLQVTRVAYPAPPVNFVATAEVQFLLQRYIDHVAGREPLPAMAYFALTVVETLGGGRKAAAARFKVDLNVLSKVGELSAAGDHKQARKVVPGKPLSVLTPQQASWLSEAVKALIRRLGEEAGGATLSQLTFAHLPKL